MGQRIEVVVTAGPDVGKRFVFAGGPIRVGRGSWPQVSLDNDDGVSRKHLIINFRRSSRFEVLDMSTGGTYVNNQRIRKATFPLGTVLKLGETMLRIGDAPTRQKTRIDLRGVSQPLRTFLPLSAVALILVLAVLVVRSPDNSKPSPGKEPLSDPTTAIETGRFDDALELLKTRVNAPASGTDADGQLFGFVVKLRDRRETADRFEASYKFDAARDVWLMLQLSLPEEWNGLRDWIQTEQIERIERRMENVGQR